MSSAQPVVLARHKYTWAVREIVQIAIVAVLTPILLVWAGPKPENITWWLLVLSSPVGAGLLANLNRSRKSTSEVRIEEKDGLWHLRRGGAFPGNFGTVVDPARVDRVAATSATKVPELALIFSGDETTGETAKSLRIPSRILENNPEFADRVRALTAGIEGRRDAAVRDFLG